MTKHSTQSDTRLRSISLISAWKSLNDARFSYTYKSVPYAAKPQAGDGLHYIKANIDYVKYLIQNMEKQQLVKCRIISADRLYTSIESANWVLARDTTTVETLQKGKQGISLELFDTQDKDEFSAICHFEKGKKDICVMSHTIKIR